MNLLTPSMLKLSLDEAFISAENLTKCNTEKIRLFKIQNINLLWYLQLDSSVKFCYYHDPFVFSWNIVKTHFIRFYSFVLFCFARLDKMFGNFTSLNGPIINFLAVISSEESPSFFMRIIPFTIPLLWSQDRGCLLLLLR